MTDNATATAAAIADELRSKGALTALVDFTAEVVARTGLVRHDSTRDRRSVPLVAAQGTQIALYPMSRRIGVALDPESAAHFSALTGARVEEKSPTTHYLHLREEHVTDPARRTHALAAADRAVEVCRDRPAGPGRG
jgi:hypothetical protein